MSYTAGFVRTGPQLMCAVGKDAPISRLPETVLETESGVTHAGALAGGLNRVLDLLLSPVSNMFLS